MASYTPNYNLKKPADADTYDIADANGNMDLIDTALHSQNEAIANINTPSLISVSDFNSLTTPGRYSLGGNYTNAPKQNLYGYVDVVNYGSNTIAQTVYSFASTGSTIYERRITGSTWGSWEELALNSDTLSISTGNVTAIASGSNLNNYTTPGTYSVANYSAATGITNMPVIQAGRLIVAYGAGGTDYKRQIYIPYGSNDIYIRYKTDSWSDWGQLALNSKMQAGMSTSLSTDIKQVTFPKAFSSAPAVVITPNSGSTMLSATVLNITTTGFYVNVWKADGTRTQADFQWIAIEK